MSMREGQRHLLLWYVSGRIGLRERREIDRHLQECEDCRAEVASLASMMRSVQSVSGIEHVAAADLALYEEEPLSMGADRRAPIESHLAVCPECREDLVTLRRARRLETAPVPATQARRPAGRRWFLPAAAAAAVAVVALLPAVFKPAGNDLRPAGPRSAVFAAPRRGAEAGRTLEGAGPWAIRVLLPFDARAGRYRVNIVRAGGPRLPELETTASTDGDRCLTVTLPRLPGPGRYEMTLRSDPPDVEEPYLYPFELLPVTGRRPVH
jgi:Putative zinc-finger